MKLTLFIQQGCPFCRQALGFIEDAAAELGIRPDIEIIDELACPDIADAYDYYYVPTFYRGREKLHEGAVDYDTVKNILAK